MRITIDSHPDDIWQTGTIHPGSYSVRAKIYALPSSFGIEGGTVSKLEVRNKGGRVVLSYDRGWERRPSWLVGRLIVRTVLKAFPVAAEAS